MDTRWVNNELYLLCFGRLARYWITENVAFDKTLHGIVDANMADELQGRERRRIHCTH